MKTKSGTETITAATSIITIVWAATLSAPLLSLAPIRLETAELPPTPRPAATAMIMKKNGKKNPTADKASAPNPETHKASTKLYIICTDMAMIIGIESLMIACWGLPSKVLTPAVC